MTTAASEVPPPQKMSVGVAPTTCSPRGRKRSTFSDGARSATSTVSTKTRAQLLLKEAGLQATSRLKNINTIIEKLRRERTRLAEMQDIGGLRIVLKVDLTGQDKIVSKILDMFRNAKVIDRRESPKHGYHAVHVIALLDERRIEIQLRTQLQDLWAQAIERLADEAGRDIRYGGTPKARREDVESVLNLANDIAQVEGTVTTLNKIKSEWPQPNRAHIMSHPRSAGDRTTRPGATGPQSAGDSTELHQANSTGRLAPSSPHSKAWQIKGWTQKPGRN